MNNINNGLKNENKSNKILFYDDNYAIRDMMNMYFGIYNFNVISASNPKEVIDVFNENDISLCILDILYSDSTSNPFVELARRIRKLNPDVPILGHTNDLSNMDNYKKMTNLYVDVLSKLDNFDVKSKKINQVLIGGNYNESNY